MGIFRIESIKEADESIGFSKVDQRIKAESIDDFFVK